MEPAIFSGKDRAADADQLTMFFDTPHDTLGFDWGGNVIGPGIQAGVSSLLGMAAGSKSANPCLQKQVSGDSAMGKCVPQVMLEFDKLEANMMQMSAADVKNAALAIASVFSDPRYFDQEIGGKSKQIREAAQQQAQQRAAAIIAKVDQITGQAPATGTPAAAAGGIDTNTLLMIGGGVLLFFLITK
jgi:hypothetical protein